MLSMRWFLLSLLLLETESFVLLSREMTSSSLNAAVDRRQALSIIGGGAVLVFSGDSPSYADFTPGGTLVDRTIGVQVGNPEASASRKSDNANVLFDKDHYFKFGTAAPWIEAGATDFPASMPFTKVQQRYDALKKYQERIQSGIATILGINSLDVVPDPTGTDVYQLRPMGLLANALLASENTGTPNELFLARWYINELYLLIGDYRQTPSPVTYAAIRRALNSYLTLMNRVITPKVGDKFAYA